MGDGDAEAVRAAIYARQSRDFSGQEHSVTRQREDCQELAARRGWHIAATLTDNDLSAAGKRRRPGFETLLSEIGRGGVSAVIAWNFDRLTRNARDRLRLLEAGRERGLIIALVRGSDLDLSTPSGRFTAGMLGEVAQHEIDVKADRQRRAALQRSQIGKPPLGVRLTGYTSSGELVEPEAAMVRQVFDRFHRGDSLHSLASWLTVGGLAARHGETWSPSTVSSILRNPRYAGRAVYQGKPNGLRGAWEPLVDEDVFDAIQARLADPRRRTQVSTDRKYLGSGLYVCGVCGRNVSAWSGYRYRCKVACSLRSGAPVDEFVLAAVRHRLARPDLVNLLPVEDAPEVKRLTDALTRLRSRQAAVDGDYDGGLIDGQRYATATEKIRSEVEGLQAALSSATRGQEAAALRSGDPVKVFDESSLMMRQAIIRALCTVRLFPAPRGVKVFDPATVRIEWRS